MNVERTHAYATEASYKITELIAELSILRSNNDIDDTMSMEVNDLLLKAWLKSDRQEKLLHKKLAPLNSRKGR